MSSTAIETPGREEMWQSECHFRARNMYGHQLQCCVAQDETMQYLEETATGLIKAAKLITDTYSLGWFLQS